MTRILLVDDEPSLVWAVKISLGDDGYEVLTAYDGEEGLTLARRHRPDLIVLDIVMPRLDGFQVCRKLRQDPTLAAVPIVFLTARGTLEDRITGLDSGGDDYVTKPFSLCELKARIRALLRRSCYVAENNASVGEGGALLRAGSLCLNLNTYELAIKDKTVRLTPTEFDLVYYLMTHVGEVLSSQQLLHQVWGYAPHMAEPSLVRWHMKNLRAKIELNPADPVYIRTVPHHGYFLAT